MSERSLGDPHPDEGDGLDPTTYDVRDYAIGVRPGRRSVTIVTRPDLYPQVQDVVDRINAAPDDADVDDLIDEFDRLKAGTVTTFTLERRSPEWVKKVTGDALEAMGAPRNGFKDAADGTFTERDAVKVTCHLIAGQIVSPDGWDVDRLMDLYDAAEEELNRLAEALLLVNQGQSEALTLDFSRRRSTNRGTRRSSTS